MSSIAYNLKRKMEWMGRQLRKMDEAQDIKHWVSTMREINGLLKEIDKKDYKDTWKPWSMRVQRGKKEGQIDQGATIRPNMKSWMMDTVPPRELKCELKSSGSELMNNGDRKRCRPPRVEVEGDDVEMLAPKAAVLKLMKDPLDLHENIQQETSWPKGELSLDEGKKNREIWRKGMLERLRKQKVPRGHWEDVGSGNFQGLMSFSAPFEVRMAVLKDMGKTEADEWLYQEMMRYYDTGPSIDN